MEENKAIDGLIKDLIKNNSPTNEEKARKVATAMYKKIEGIIKGDGDITPKAILSKDLCFDREEYIGLIADLREALKIEFKSDIYFYPSQEQTVGELQQKTYEAKNAPTF